MGLVLPCGGTLGELANESREERNHSYTGDPESVETCTIDHIYFEGRIATRVVYLTGVDLCNSHSRQERIEKLSDRYWYC